MNDIRRIAVVGTGVIGAGWVTRFLARGLEVVAYDPAPGAEDRLKDSVARAWPAAVKSGLALQPLPPTFQFESDLSRACANVDWVQENAPENEDLKRGLLSRIDAVAPASAMIASSSSGLLPTKIQSDCAHPERVVIGHPFNPVYLLPLVEVLGGEKTDPASVDRASAFYTSLGMRALKVRREVEGYISDRLQEALWREALHMVADGVATTEEIDAAVIYGPGLRWAIMGTCLTFHLAGGEAGMRHMLEQFGPALELPWTKLKAPALTETLIDRMVEGTQAQAGGRSVEELERIRDDCLIGIMDVLKAHDHGAGKVLKDLGAGNRD
jgi:carnitine 3-dehydrogenase